MNKFYSSIILIFIYSCGGGGGGGGGGTTAPVTPAPTVAIAADPLTVLLTNTSTITWSSTNATSCTASGSWSGSKAISGSEAVTISTTGNNTYTLSCSGAGGSGNASVTVEGYRNTDGIVVDGYIRGAEVFIDEDEDWIADSNESSTTSDNDGKFTIKYANGFLVSIGGTDLDSNTLLDNLLITQKLTGHSDFKAVTPVTSVAAFMTEASNINAALGIDTSIDINSFDPVANKGDGGINDYLYEKGNQLTVLAYSIQNITNDLNTSTETTQDYFKAITEEIEKEYTETETKVDIETEAFITKTIDNVILSKSLVISDQAKENIIKVLSGVMPIIEVKSNNDLTTSVIRFSVSTLQNDIKAIANGTASDAKVASYTQDILNFIASDQSVNADEIAPNIIAANDSVLTNEDTVIAINILANDSLVTSAPFTISVSSPSNGTVVLDNNIVTYTPSENFNGSDSFNYIITQGEKSSSADVDITIESVEDEPAIDLASTIQVAENQTAIATISISDGDAGDTLTLTLGGTDASSLILSSDNVLSFATAPDYETKTSYSITLSLTDGKSTSNKDITINITNVNDNSPVFTSSATLSAAENQTAIDTVTATDADGGSVTFTVSGSELAITSAGVLTFASAPDYETKSTYTATVTSSDGTNSTTQAITVNVTDVNDNSPVFTSSTTFSGDENQTSIGSVTASDADNDQLTFAISGSDLAITSAGVLTFISAPDYETKTSYTATVTVTDGINALTQDITVSVNNVNDNSPVFTSSTTFSAAENQRAIGTVTATDADGTLPTYTVSGSELSISSSGVLTFISAPDYETKTTYTATLTAADGPNSTTQDVQINITNVADTAPVITSGASFNVDENKNGFIADVVATDASTFSITGSDIDISPAGGLIFKIVPNYETKSSYSETVTASNAFGSATQVITVTINDLQESPVFTSVANFYVTEAGDEETISVSVAANENGSGNVYVINGEQKKSLTLVAGTKYTFTHPTNHPLKFSSTDDGTHGGGTEYTTGINTSSDGLTIITATSETPSTLYYYCSIHSGMGSDAAIQVNQTDIGTLSADDDDGETLTFSISGPDAASINLNESSGVMKFNIVPKYSTKNLYTAIASVTDGNTTVNKNIYININAITQVTASCEEPYYSVKPSPVSADSVYRYYNYSWQGKPKFCINFRQPELLEDVWETKITDGLTFIKNTLGMIAPLNTFIVDQKNASSATLTQIDRDLCKIRNQGGSELENCVNNSDPWGNRSAAAGVGYNYLQNGSELNFFRNNWTDGGAPVRILMHEYFHTYQNSMKFYFEEEDRFGIKIDWEDNPSGRNDRVRVEVFPGWLEEGGADFAGWAMSSKFNRAIDVRSQMIEHLDEAREVVADAAANGDTVSLKDYEYQGYLYESADNPNSGQTRKFAYAYTGGFMAFVYLWSLDDSNYQKAIVDYYKNYAEKDLANPGQGWKDSFESVFGMTMQKFYTDFDAFMRGSRESQLAAIKTNEQWRNATLVKAGINIAPVFTSAATFTAAENQTAIGTVTASDAESSSITFSISGSELAISSAGVLTFTSAPDYETKSSYTSTVSISDGVNTVTQDITVTVTDVTETSSETIQVSIQSNGGLAYVINGEARSSLTLNKGTTYTFNHSSAHPFRFSETSNGTHAGGSEYTTGVTKSSGSTVIVVDASTATTLYYYCSVHSGMGGIITIN